MAYIRRVFLIISYFSPPYIFISFLRSFFQSPNLFNLNKFLQPINVNQVKHLFQGYCWLLVHFYFVKTTLLYQLLPWEMVTKLLIDLIPFKSIYK